MYCLKIDLSKCDDCFRCEEVLPKFRTVYGGYLMISDNKHGTEEVVESVSLVQRSCPTNAIIYYKLEQDR